MNPRALPPRLHPFLSISTFSCPEGVCKEPSGSRGPSVPTSNQVQLYAFKGEMTYNGALPLCQRPQKPTLLVLSKPKAVMGLMLHAHDLAILEALLG